MKGMKKHGMMYGGKVKKMAGGGKMKMVRSNDGWRQDCSGARWHEQDQRLCKRQEGYALP